MVYIKLFVDYLDAMEALGDAERGRLITALLTYARTGEPPQLSGNERILFPMMRAQIDRDAAAMEEDAKTKSEAGKKGAAARWQSMANDGSAKQCHKSHGKNGKEEEKDKDKDKDDITLSDESVARPRARFCPPTVEEVAAYCSERGNSVDPAHFVDYYTVRGWKVGKASMKDWKAAVRTWERNGFDSTVKASGEGSGNFDTDDFFDAAVQRSYGGAE